MSLLIQCLRLSLLSESTKKKVRHYYKRNYAFP